MGLADRLRRAGANIPGKKKDTLWRGPYSAEPLGGVTYSMLNRFLQCRERFRITYIEGLRPVRQFDHKIEYGHLWHACEQALAEGVDWEPPLKAYAQLLARKTPLAGEQIEHWYNVCKVQFPIYVDYWRSHPDTVRRTPLLEEQVFDVPYLLPSGRTVRLRGRWDSVELVGSGDTAGIYLQENKTKGDIWEEGLKRQLTFDLQTMLYLTALAVDDPRMLARTDAVNLCPDDKARQKMARAKVLGVRYNVIRRPLSGGKGSIVRHKPSKSNPQGESKEEFYERVAAYINEEPERYFMRWKVEVGYSDLSKFKRECLNPILEHLCNWWEYIDHQRAAQNDPFAGYTRLGGFWECPHWRHPFGVYNVLNEGGSSDLDEYLASGSEVGLERIETLFEELQ